MSNIEYATVKQLTELLDRKNHELLLRSGMFFEFHPYLTGEWEVDAEIITTELEGRVIPPPHHSCPNAPEPEPTQPHQMTCHSRSLRQE